MSASGVLIQTWFASGGRHNAQPSPYQRASRVPRNVLNTSAVWQAKRAFSILAIYVRRQGVRLRSNDTGACTAKSATVSYLASAFWRCKP